MCSFPSAQKIPPTPVVALLLLHFKKDGEGGGLSPERNGSGGVNQKQEGMSLSPLPARQMVFAPIDPLGMQMLPKDFLVLHSFCLQYCCWSFLCYHCSTLFVYFNVFYCQTILPTPLPLMQPCHWNKHCLLQRGSLGDLLHIRNHLFPCLGVRFCCSNGSAQTCTSNCWLKSKWSLEGTVG